MAKVVGDIAVKVGADVSPLQKQMKRGQRSMKDFEKSTSEMAVNVAKAGAVMVTAMAAVAGGVLKMASEAAKAGVEIKNLSQIANTNTTTFQKMADASKTVGIEQQKLADILKDVNDKVGDFIVTGGGPMADFFENIAPKVGITAEAFRDLSGPDALQLYVSSLEKAGVSQQQMTFYMEAIASDATALIPLLRNNGSEMARLGDEAERAGRILSQETVAGAAELDRELDQLASTLKTQATAAVLEHKDELIVLAKFITEDVVPAIATMFNFVIQGVEGWKMIGEAALEAGEKIKNAITLQGEFDRSFTPETGQSAIVGGLPPGLSGPAPEGGLADYLESIGEPVPAATDEASGTPTPTGIYSGRGTSAGAGSDVDDMLEALVEERQRQHEAIEEEERGHAGRMADIAADLADEETRIREEAMRQEIAMRSQTADMAIGLLANLGKESEVFAKAAVALNAAKSISEAIQNTSVAYTKALTVDPTGAMAARVALMGKAQIGIIAANAALNLAGGTGGGSSGGAGGGGAGQTAPVANQTQDRSLTLIGDNFNRKQAIDIAEYMNEGSDNGLIIRGRA